MTNQYKMPACVPSCDDWPARLAAMDDLIERPRLPRHWASASLCFLLRVRSCSLTSVG